MIAEILSSSTTFAAVDYNERKVSKGVAELLEMKNFSYLENLGIKETTAIQNYLLNYSAQNDRIENTQFHVAISCKEKEYSHTELLNIAHQYLKKMGYGEEGQPLLIYGHHDTDNNHIHIITSRVAPNGKKIDDSFERVKSQQIIDEIMGVDRNHRIEKAISVALTYKFENLSQFKAILEASGYECFDVEDKLNIKRSGVVQRVLSVENIKLQVSSDYLKESRKKQLKAILLKYRDMVASKEELKGLMKSKFGVDLIFVGSKDNPYGYMVVDHKEKSIYKGSSVLPLKVLLTFQNKQERLEKLDMFIDSMLDDNNRLTTTQLNSMLHRQFGTHISKGKIIVGKERIILEKYILDTLKRNDKCAWLQSFNPTTETERALLCIIGKIKDPELVSICESKKATLENSVNTIKNIVSKEKQEKYLEILRGIGVITINSDMGLYFIDMNNKQIFNATDYGISLNNKNEIKSLEESIERSSLPNIIFSVDKIIKGGNQGGATNSNREGEVGSHRKYDDIDDERTLKM